MSVKPITSSAIVSPTPKMPDASTEAKVSKFMQDDKLPSSRLPKKPTRNFAVHHLSTIEELDETELPKPIERPSAPKNSAPPVTKSPQEDLRRIALMNKTMSSDHSK